MEINTGDLVTQLISFVGGSALTGLVTFVVLKSKLESQQKEITELKEEGETRYTNLINAINTAITNTANKQMESIERMVGSFTEAINNQVDLHKEYKTSFIRVHDLSLIHISEPTRPY